MVWPVNTPVQADTITQIMKIVFFILGFGILLVILATIFDRNLLPDLNQDIQKYLLLFSLLLILFGHFSQFKKIKILDFEAELWEDSQREAVILTQKLKDLSIKLYKPVAYLAASSGRYGSGFSQKELHSLMADISSGLKAMGHNENEISNVFEPIKKYILWDHILKISQESFEYLKNDSKLEKAHKLSNEMQENWHSNFDVLDSHLIDIENSIMNFQSINEDEKEPLIQHLKPLIEDYKYYFEKSEFRRPNEWN